MEYFWYVVAAVGAGLGTGLTGISAATVMVPILVVCTSFGSIEGGAYMAAAVALASDVIGSAVSAGIYAKHKNIDIRHSWPMMICILCMSVLGSYLASLTASSVLGWISLAFALIVGIRFLVRPDTTHEDLAGRQRRLQRREVIIEVVCGLLIGFVTGYGGSGGGMFMLLVFTALLWYDLKTAVGTSTFIMAFSALIGFISHSTMMPEVIFDHWDALLICALVATAASVVSAQFANKASNKTVGRCTGIVLTILSVVLIVINALR